MPQVVPPGLVYVFLIFVAPMMNLLLGFSAIDCMFYQFKSLVVRKAHLMPARHQLRNKKNIGSRTWNCGDSIKFTLFREFYYFSKSL